MGKQNNSVEKFELIKATSFHEDVFYEYFHPFRHPAARFNIWGGHGLETFGEDLLIVREYAQEYVWTVVDCDNDQWIIPEFHHINRICYLLTEVPHNGAPVEFRISRSTLTPLGLKRRIATLRKVLNQSGKTP